MDAARAQAPFSSSESATAARSRRLPLHTCGVSFIALAHIAFTRSQDIDGRLGSLMRRMAAPALLFSPILSAMLYLWLASLSIFDGYVLAIENLIEIAFPPSARVFKKIDKLIQMVEVLPRKVDDAINKFSMAIHETSFLEYAVVHVISLLKFVLSLLTLDNTMEKEITIDTNYKLFDTESVAVGKTHEFAESPTHVKNEHMEQFPPLVVSPRAGSETDESTAKPDTTKCSYKEGLERGAQENVESKESGAGDEKVCSYNEALEEGTQETVESKDGSAIEEKVTAKKNDDDAVEEQATENKTEYYAAEQKETESKKEDAVVEKVNENEKEDDVVVEKDTANAKDGDAVEEEVIESKKYDNAVREELAKTKEDDATEGKITETEKVDVVETVGEGKEGKDSSDSEELDDPILRLFHSSWHMTPPKRK